MTAREDRKHDESDTTDLESLKQRVRQAREAGDHAKAVAAAERLVELAPDQWGFVVGLALALDAAHRPDEADSLLRRATHTFPDQFWVWFHWTLLTVRARKLDAAEVRASRLLDRFPQMSQAQELAGDVAVQQKEFSIAASHYKAALSLDNASARCAEKLSVAALYDRVTRHIQPTSIRSSGAECHYAVAFINMDRSVDRLRVLQESFEDCPARMIRVPAVPGSYLPFLTAQKLTGAEKPQRGTLGNFLSHILAWEMIVRDCIPTCLVIEDDAYPLIRLPASLKPFGLPPDFDLCFVNRRMERIVDFEERSGTDRFITYSPLDTVKTFPSTFRAPGTDGYLITAQGAQKLLDFVARDGFGSFADWRLLAYCMSAEDVRQLTPGTPATLSLQQLHSTKIRGPERLSAFTLYPCLIEQCASPSVITQENTCN